MRQTFISFVNLNLMVRIFRLAVSLKTIDIVKKVNWSTTQVAIPYYSELFLRLPLCRRVGLSFAKIEPVTESGFDVVTL